MPGSWVAASVRARLLARRRLGSAGARDLSRHQGLPSALEVLARSPYGADIAEDMTLEAAQRHVAATLLWNLRLIGGWLPPGGVQIVQPLAAWFELANIEERLTYLGGGGHPAPYQLGRLAVAWPAVARATTPESVRVALAGSRWGDPGDSDPDVMLIVLRFRWAVWVATSVPDASAWAASASALLGARIRFAVQPRPALPPQAAAAFGLPPAWLQAADLAELRAMMPRHTAWTLDAIDDPADLWRAEVRWWARLRTDAGRLLVSSSFAPGVVLGAVALLAHDCWLTRAALAAVARGDSGRMVFDAVA